MRQDVEGGVEQGGGGAVAIERQDAVAVAIAEGVDYPRQPHLHPADRKARQDVQQRRGGRCAARKCSRARFEGRQIHYHEQEIALKRLQKSIPDGQGPP